MSTRLFNLFNTPETNLIISGYPERYSRGENNYGIAWYTKETIEPIAKKYGSKFVVLCETNHNNEPEVCCEDKILILRVFDQKHPTLFPRILKWMVTFNKIKNVYVHSEFCTNGGIKNFILLIPFLILIKIFGKNITYFSHNVVTDFSAIAPHLHLDKNPIAIGALNFSVKTYYRLLGIICNRVVVMDEEMKRRIINFIDLEKVVCLPFWSNKNKSTLTKTQAIKKLGLNPKEFIVLFFGFITWYKGADWLISQFLKIKQKNIKLILAGGKAYSLKDKPYYEEFYAKQLERAASTKNIQLTGFVKEKDIEKYFTSSDVVILPYRGLIGSSGSLAHAIQYKKPFLLSEKMQSTLNNPVFAKALENSNLKKSDLTFTLKNGALLGKIRKLTSNNKIKKLAKFSAEVNNKRDISFLLDSYYQTIFNNTTKEQVKKRTVHAPFKLAFR